MDGTMPNGGELTRRALWIINPAAGRRTIQRFIPSVLRILMDAGYMVTTLVTARKGEATELAERYAGDFDLIVCSGGDGTLNETVTGLVRSGSSLPVGYIPCGTTNDFAAARGLPRDAVAAARRIAAGQVSSCDLGRFGSRFFVNSAVFGAFSWMAYTTDQTLKNTLGYTAYLLDGMMDLSRIRPIHMKLTADGREWEGDYVFGAVSNASALGGIIELPVDPDSLSDGLLELTLIRAPRTLQDLDIIVHSILNKDFSGSFLTVTRVRELLVENDPELRWSLDGEDSGALDRVEIRAVPGLLRLRS